MPPKLQLPPTHRMFPGIEPESVINPPSYEEYQASDAQYLLEARKKALQQYLQEQNKGMFDRFLDQRIKNL